LYVYIYSPERLNNTSIIFCHTSLPLPFYNQNKYELYPSSYDKKKAKREKMEDLPSVETMNRAGEKAWSRGSGRRWSSPAVVVKGCDQANHRRSLGPRSSAAAIATSAMWRSSP
jgi:hypothetical protein